MNGGDRAPSDTKAELSREDALDYLASMLGSMGKIAESYDLLLLSYLLSLAEREAKQRV